MMFFTGSAQTTSWKGITSTAWATATNWTNGIPSATVSAILGDANFTGAFQPKITAAATSLNLTIGGTVTTTLTVSSTITISGNLLINSGSTIAQTASTMSLVGNWTNNGTYTATGASTLFTFKGTAQSLGGTAASTAFMKLTINAGAIITLNQNISTAAAFAMNGTLIPSEAITPVVSGTGPMTVGSASTLKVNAATFAGNYTIPTTVNANSTVEYSATLINQTVSSAYTYSTLTISGAGTTKTMAGNTTYVSSGSTYGKITVNSGILDLGLYSATRGTTVAGGTLTVAAGATLKIGGLTTSFFPTNFTTITLASTGTVEYNGAGTQLVKAATYGNLYLTGTGGAASIRTMPATAFTVAGNLVSRVSGGGSLTYTAASAITVTGNDTVGVSTTFDAGASAYIFKVSKNLYNDGTITGNTSSTITMAGANTSLSGTGTNNFNNFTTSATGITATSNAINVSGTLALTTGTFTQAAGGTLQMTGSGKTITGTGFTFSTLSIATGASISTAVSLAINGDLSLAGTGTFSATAGTITMAGSSNAISSGGGTLSLFSLVISSTASVSTAANITIVSTLNAQGSYTASANTTTFNGAVVLSGTANLYNISILSTKSLQLNTNAALSIAGSFTNSGTFNATTTTPNTVTYNGGAQSILGLTYNNLTLANGNTKTAAAAVTVNGSLTINASTTFDPVSYSHVIQNNLANSGTFATGTGTVTFNGANNASITGATTFNILTVNKSSSTNILTLANNVSAATVNMTLGSIATGTNTLTITTTRTGSGIITGIITRTHTFTVGTTYAFEGANNLITFSGSSSVTSVTEKITSGSVSDFPFGGSLNRAYDISSVTGSFGAATLRLHYEDVELNGNTESAIQLWHYNGSSWGIYGKTSNDVTNNYVEQTGITTLTNRWTFSDNNNVVSWNGSVSTDWFTAGNWTTVQGSPGKPPTANDIVQIGDANFTGSNQPSINAAAVAKAISFGSAKASTLTLTTGGSLADGGNISGTWSANATHNINTNGQNLTVSGDIILSDGTTGHSINLTIGTGTVTVSGNVTETGDANINFSGAGAMNIGNNFNYTSGMFTAGTGTLTYNGTTAQTVAAVTYNNLTVNKSSGIASIVNTTIGGNLTATAGELDINAATTITGNVLISASGKIVKTTTDTLTVGGNWTNSGLATVTTGIVKFNGSSAQTLGGATTFNTLVVSKTAATTLTLGANIIINSNLAITGGNLDLVTYTANRASSGGTFALANGSTLSVAGANNFPASYITYTMDTTSSATSGTVIYNGTVGQTVAAVAYGNLSFSGASTKTLSAGTTTVKGNLAINSGATLDASANTISLYGNWTNSGTFTASTGTCNFNGLSNTITGNTTFYKALFNGNYTVAGSNITYSSDFRVANGGTLDAGSGVMTVSGDYTNNGSFTNSGTLTFSGTVVQNITVQSALVSTSTGTVNFNGTVSPVFNTTTATSFATVNINNTGGVSASMAWPVSTAFTVAGGATWAGGPYMHIFSGAFTNNGTVTSSGILFFTPTVSQSLKFLGTAFTSTGMVILGGTGAISTTGSAPSFNDIIIANSTGVSPGTNWTINGDLLINNAAILNPGSFTYSAAGDITNNGILNPGTSVFSMTSNGGTINGNATTTFYDLTIASGARTLVGSDFNISRNLTTTGNLDAGSATVNFTGATASTISGTSTNLSQFTIAKNAGVSTTLARNADSVQVITVTGGIFDAAGYTITQDPTGGAVNILAVGPAGTFRTSGTFPAMTNYSLDSLSTVEYYGTTQTIKSLSASVTDLGAPSAYGNLTVSSAGTKTANGPLNIRNTLTLATATLSFPNGGTNYADTLGGNWNMTSGVLTPGTTALVFNGTGIQTVSSTGSFNNININKTAGYVSLTGNVTTTGTVTFTAGKIYTSSNTLAVGTGTVSGAAQGTGWVNGNLQKTIATGAVSKTFETGDAAGYSPVTVSFTNVSTGGSLTAKATGTEHPQISTSGVDSTKSVNRYWTITNSGIVFTNSGATATVTVNWLSSDVDAGSTTANFITGMYNGSAWSFPTVASPLSTSIQTTGLTSFSDIAVGTRGARTWVGGSSTNWYLAANWSPASIPLNTEDVIIAGGGTTVNINNNIICNNISFSSANTVLSIAAGNSLTVNGNLNLANAILDINGQTLTINGTFNGSAANCIRGSKTSALIIGSSFSNTGSSLYFDQTAATFNNYLQTFTVNKTATVANTLNIATGAGAATGTISIAAGATLNTGGFITIKSDSVGTARLASLPVDGSGVATAFINGDIGLERYVPAKRTWRLLSSPLKSVSPPTINTAWQEGVTTASGTPNPNAGFGTQITGGSVANGFDQSPTNGSSIKYYNTTSFSLQPLPSTNIPITNYPGYFVFVRGDRSINLTAGGSAAPTNATLRMKGQIATGQQTATVLATHNTLVGNPYPSAIDFGSLTKTNVANIIYLWDPKLGGANGVGGYVTGTWNSGSSSYVFTASVSPVSQYIPSGEAFFVVSADGINPGTLTIKETDKSTGGSDRVFGFTASAMNGASVKVKLMGVNANNSTVTTDGLVALYGDDNNNSVTAEDAKKILNGGENISIKREGQLLSIEQRKTFAGNDTLPVNCSQLKQQGYRLEIIMQGMSTPGLTAILKDNFAPDNNNLALSVSDTNRVSFTVTSNPASYAADRFSIIFGSATVVPVTFTSVNATRRQNDISVTWKTENEINMASYTVESSSNGMQFSPAATVAAHINQPGLSYQWMDLNANSGAHYYRIKGTENNGHTIYSPIVKVAAETNESAEVKVYAAPGGNALTLSLSGLPKDSYTAEVFDNTGRLLQKSTIVYAGGNESFHIAMNNYASGEYRVKVSSQGKSYTASFIK